MMKQKLKSMLALVVLAISLGSCGGGVSESVSGRGAPSTALKPRFAYAVNVSDNTVSMYTVNAETGQLRHNGYIATASNPISIAVDPSSRFAYVATSGSNNNVSVYKINQNSGVLSFVGFATAGTNPRSITVDPLGKFVYAVNSDSANISVFEITSTQGELLSRQTVNIGTNPNLITFHPTGKFAYVPTPLTNSIVVYDVNEGGELSSKGTATTGSTPRSIAIDPSGKFAYTVNFNGNSISMHTVNADTGQLRYNGYIATATKPISVSVDPSGQFVYVANNGSNNISTFTINPTIGTLTFAGNVDAGTNPYSLSIDPSGRFLYAANQTSNDVVVYSINVNTGMPTKPSIITGRNGPVSMAIASGQGAVQYVPKYEYAVNAGSRMISAYSINPFTGALDSMGTTMMNYSPQFVTVDPFSRFLYVAGFSETTQGTHYLSGYSINQSTGALTSGISAYPQTSARTLTIDTSGRFAYVAGIDMTNGSGKIWIYNINQITGALTPGTPSTVAAGTTPVAITIDPSGRFAYVANADSHDILVYSIDPVTGALTQTNGGILCSTDSDPQSVTFDPSGRFAYIVYRFNNTIPNLHRVATYEINQITGAFGASGSNIPIGFDFCSLSLDPSGRFAYAANNSSSVNPPIYSISAYNINQNTGDLSAFTSGGSVSGDNSILSTTAIDPSGRYIYAATSGAGNEIKSYSIDRIAGILSQGPSVSVEGSISSMVIVGTIE